MIWNDLAYFLFLEENWEPNFLKKSIAFLIGYQIIAIIKVKRETIKAIISDNTPPPIPGPRYKNDLHQA
jgi:hypothetical protein